MVEPRSFGIVRPIPVSSSLSGTSRISLDPAIQQLDANGMKLLVISPVPTSPQTAGSRARVSNLVAILELDAAVRGGYRSNTIRFR